MDLNPPAGSKISIVSDGADPIVIIPAANSPTRYFTGLFLLVWLGGWAPAPFHKYCQENHCV